MDEKLMAKAISKTGNYKKVTGWFLDLKTLELESDVGTNAFYAIKIEARNDLLDTFNNQVCKKDYWIDILSDGSFGDQCFVDTKKLYNMLKKDKIIK